MLSFQCTGQLDEIGRNYLEKYLNVIIRVISDFEQSEQVFIAREDILSEIYTK